MLPLSRRSLCSASSCICSHRLAHTTLLRAQGLSLIAPRPPLLSSPASRSYATRARKVSRRSTKEESVQQEGDEAKTETETALSRNPLGRSRAEEFLQQIGSGSREVTLADIERYKPSGHAAVDSPLYEKQYAELIDTLMRTFSLDQFKQFVALYHLEPPKGRRTKWYYVATVVEKQWGWPSIADLKKKRKEWTEIVFKSYPLDVNQAFLMLGKDGSDLLALSSQYNVHVSFSPQPLALKVEGVKGSVQKITEHVEEIKKEITEELFALPGKVSIDATTLQRISKTSGAFLENTSDGIVKIYSRSTIPHVAHYAKTLLIQASISAKEHPATFIDFSEGTNMGAQGADLEPSKGGFALYPFFSRQPLPTAMRSHNIFRLRAIERQFGAMFDDPADVLDENQVVKGPSGSVEHLKDILNSNMNMISSDPQSSLEVSASFGHVVITGEDPKPTILPPLLGYQTPQSVIDFLSQQSQSQLFIPSLPSKLSGTSMTQPKMSHRLVYRALPSSQARSDPSNATPFMSFSVVLNTESRPKKAAEPQKPATEELELDDDMWSDAALSAESLDSQITMEPECKVGSTLDLNLAMPSRLMDIRFTLTDASVIPSEKWPTELQSYYESLREHLAMEGLPRPNPPLFLQSGGVTYGLDLSCNIRQEDESVEGVDKTISNVVENVLDLGSGERHKRSQVSYNVVPSNPSWKPLLSAIDILNTPPKPRSAAFDDEAEQGNSGDLF